MSIFSYFFKKSIYKSKLEKYRLKDYDKAINFYEDAIKDYDRAIELDNNYFEAYRNRANAKYSLGLYREALKDYKNALELDTTNNTVIENIKNIENKYGLK